MKTEDRDIRLFSEKTSRKRKTKQTNDIHDVTSERFRKALQSEGGCKISQVTKEELLYYMIKVDKNLFPETKINRKKTRMSKEGKEANETIEKSVQWQIVTTKLEGEMGKLWDAVNKVITDEKHTPNRLDCLENECTISWAD